MIRVIQSRCSRKIRSNRRSLASRASDRVLGPVEELDESRRALEDRDALLFRAGPGRRQVVYRHGSYSATPTGPARLRLICTWRHRAISTADGAEILASRGASRRVGGAARGRGSHPRGSRRAGIDGRRGPRGGAVGALACGLRVSHRSKGKRGGRSMTAYDGEVARLSGVRETPHDRASSARFGDSLHAPKRAVHLLRKDHRAQRRLHVGLSGGNGRRATPPPRAAARRPPNGTSASTSRVRSRRSATRATPAAARSSRAGRSRPSRGRR